MASCPETEYHTDSSSHEGEEEEREFMANKPWLGMLYAPSKYLKDPSDPLGKQTIITSENNNWAVPEVKVELDYVFGYRARNCRNNVHWIDDRRIAFHAGAVGIVYNFDAEDQDFFRGHNDDIVCLTYHKGRNLVASGSIGRRAEVRLCIWSPDAKSANADLPQKQCISGFHQYAVLSVAFNPAGDIIASVGMDEHHSVALHSVDTGVLLASCAADKNRLIHCCFNTCVGEDSNSCFVTCGVKHICFWSPMDPGIRGGKYYYVSPEPTERRLDWQRAIECKFVDECIFNVVTCSDRWVLAGARDGRVYQFANKTYVARFAVGTKPLQSLCVCPMDPEQRSGGHQIAVGSKDGTIKFFDFSGDKMIPSSSVTLGDGETKLNMDLLDDATNNESHVLVNSVRSLAFNSATKEILVGTILNHIYTVSLPKSTSAKPSYTTHLGAHWGCLDHADGYGEIWGVDAHPTEPHVISTSSDGTVRRWDIISNKELQRFYLGLEARVVHCSVDGSMVAVGHCDGSISVVNGEMTEFVFKTFRHRVRRVEAIRFSPNNEFLAVASEMSIDIYRIQSTDDINPAVLESQRALGEETENGRTKRTMIEGASGTVISRIGTCRGHTSLLCSNTLDWNLASNIIQTNSAGCELLYFSVPDCRMVTGAHQLRDQHWFTQTCKFGWPVQGIWQRFNDGTDVNSVSKSLSERLMATTDDSGTVRVFNFPCVGSGLDRCGKLKRRPAAHTCMGHSSHVTNCVWSAKDQYLITAGGADLCIMVWKITYTGTQPRNFIDAEYVQTLTENIQRARTKHARGQQNNVDDDDMSPLKSGVPSFEDQTGQTPKDDRLASLQERLTHKQRPEELPSTCPACGFDYGDSTFQTCRRCFMPRKLQFRSDEKDKTVHIPVTKAPLLRFRSSKNKNSIDITRVPSTEEDDNAPRSLRGSNKTSGTASRFRLPTKSFCNASKCSQKQRVDVEELAKTVKDWKFCNNRAKIPKLPDDSDSDDSMKDVQVHLRTTGSAPMAPRKASRPKTATTKTASSTSSFVKSLRKKMKTSTMGKVTAGPNFVDF